MGQVWSPVDRPQAAAQRPRANSRAHSLPRRKPNRRPNSPPPRAPGAARLPSAYPLPTLPSSRRWMMLSMLSLSISAIAFPPPALPQRRRRRLAPGTHASFPTPRAQRRWWQQPLRVPPQPPRSLLPPSLHWNHEKNKMAADSLPASGGARMRAGECSGPAGTSLWAIGRAGGGGDRAREEGGARAREGGGDG